MRKIALGILLIVFSVSLSIQADTHAQKKIMVFGDSLSAAYGMKVQEGWVELLRQRLNEENFAYDVVNASISGNTSGNGLERVKTDLELHKPDIMVLELGGNDGLRGHPPRMFKSNMEKIIEAAMNQGTQVVLLGIRLPPSYGKRYIEAFESVYEKLAENYSLPFVPFFMENVGTERALMQNDGIHPNAKGQPVLLDNVWPTLRRVLNKTE